MIDYTTEASPFHGQKAIVGWGITNYRDRSRLQVGEVQQMQGFVGVDFDGHPLPHDVRDREKRVAVPEGRYHTTLDYWPQTREQACEQAAERVRRLLDEAERIVKSIEEAQRDA